MNIIKFSDEHKALHEQFLYQQSLVSDSDLQEKYDAYVQSIKLSSQQCGSCKSKGTQKIHSCYLRSVITCREEVKTPRYIVVTVVKCDCKTCSQKYHTLFPEWICPFLAYTYSFILEVLCYLYSETQNCSINKTAKHFGLERKTVRRFKELLESDQIPLRATDTFQDMAKEHKACTPLSEIRNFLELLRAKKELFWSFLLEFISQAGHTFLAAKLTYSKQEKTFHYITCPMGQVQSDTQ